MPAAFDFARDTFAFRNELVWEYHPDVRTGRMIPRRAEPRPTFALRCFAMVRAARQFRIHAQFEPGQSRPDEADCGRLVRTVIRRNPRRASAARQRVPIPGFRDLRELSTIHEGLLKQALGGAWRSYVLRSHWRMVFPFSRVHQAREAESLKRALETGRLPVVHVVRFPQLTINHGLLLFAVEPGQDRVDFMAYDPNSTGSAIRLTYHPGTRTFGLPPNHYWAGGRVDVFEIYHGWF
ncbi:MAG: hypothetical protein H7A46_06600 [Verrucomicrobiales bacterium]|nr:hypothetical protein [Verrucomicrobiales bacterium]